MPTRTVYQPELIFRPRIPYAARFYRDYHRLESSSLGPASQTYPERTQVQQ
jgi:hypothetical protein